MSSEAAVNVRLRDGDPPIPGLGLGPMAMQYADESEVVRSAKRYVGIPPVDAEWPLVWVRQTDGRPFDRGMGGSFSTFEAEVEVGFVARSPAGLQTLRDYVRVLLDGKCWDEVVADGVKVAPKVEWAELLGDGETDAELAEDTVSGSQRYRVILEV